MSVAKVIEIVGSSEESFEDAVRQALHEATRSIRGITGVDVRNFTVKVKDDQIVQWRVDCKIAFAVEEQARHLRPEMQGQAQREAPQREAPQGAREGQRPTMPSR